MVLTRTEKTKELKQILKQKTRRIEMLTPSQIQSIAQNAEKERFVVIVHPFFSEDCEEYQGKQYTKNTNYSKLLKTPTHNTTIILIDTPEGFLITAQRLRKQKNPNSPKIILVEATSKTRPDPKIGWQKVIQRLEKLGVKKVIVSGRTLVPAEITNLQRTLQRLTKDSYKVKGRFLPEEKRRIMGVRTAIRFLINQKKPSENLYGCAGHTAAKLGASGKFRVRTTKKFT